MSEDAQHPGHEGPGEHDHAGEFGDLGEEAARLMAVLAGWTRAVDEHVATGAPECEWCPVCRVLHVVRTTRPEVRDHLTAAAASLLQAASSLLAPPAGPDATGDTPGDTAGDTSGDTATDGLEHIDLDDPEGNP